MSDVRSVGYCGGLVGEVESLSAEEWRRFQGHPKYVKFMDEYLTAKCLVDFYWHLRFGVYFSAWKHYDPGLHRRVAYWLQDWRREVHGQVEPVSIKALIMSRELCKTQIMVAYDGWRFARDRNMRMIIRSYNFDLASQISSALLKMLVSTKFTRRYPWVRPSVRPGSTQWFRWTPKEFFLEREDEAVRVPSCQAVGVEGELTGGHFHLGHYDDFEVEANAKSEAGRADLFNTWKNDDNLFVAGSQRVLAGTPWDPNALIDGILNRRNGMEDHDIDLFRQPCCDEIFDTPFVGHEPVLLGDRCTVRVAGAGYPTVMGDLVTCQATVRFFSQAAGDVVEEVREVVWNDGEHFRVNRPFGELLGQPLHCVVGTEKPACPIRHTLDSVDWIPELGAALPEVVARHGDTPGVGELNPRTSLPKKEKMQGSLIFNAQMRLKSVDTSALLLCSSDVKVIGWDEVPQGVRRWRRASDFASAKATVAATSMSTGFEIDGWGFCLTHILYEPQMDTTWKLLEMMLGVKRVARLKGRLEKTTFEKSGHIEEVIKDLLPDVCRNPYAYFARMVNARPAAGMPTYAEIAAHWFTPGEQVSVPLKWLSRVQSKNDRMAKQQPVWQSGKLYILEECPHRETLFRQADRFTLASEEPFDLLDNLADLLNEGRLMKEAASEVKAKAAAGENRFASVMGQANDARSAALARGVNPGWPG